MQALSRTIALRDKCAELERHGIALSIDSFGRVNSSFSMFRHLPFAEIKIDSSFVQACASNRASANVCKSMIETAHNFGRSAVAMGIETAEDAQELARLGCDMGQGYRFGRPMTEQQLITMVMTGRSASANFCRPSAPVASGQVA
jgi:EAL domain-containing protein (putative c-di-GMP-specific phosphodiesterase class I)